MLDFELQGMRDTLSSLDGAGIAHAGAGPTLRHTRAAATLQAGPVKVALLGCADHPREWAAGGASPGINLFDPFPSGGAMEWARGEAAAARAAGADVIVLGAHYGGATEPR